MKEIINTSWKNANFLVSKCLPDKEKWHTNSKLNYWSYIIFFHPINTRLGWSPYPLFAKRCLIQADQSSFVHIWFESLDFYVGNYYYTYDQIHILYKVIFILISHIFVSYCLFSFSQAFFFTCCFIMSNWWQNVFVYWTSDGFLILFRELNIWFTIRNGRNIKIY
jgi:hypothetical protein